ncbi:MAG TPA: hypothetical protein VFU76_13155 [Terriglobales bacterium]|nr:hypothetical protein [Terriglobales bacterium]
MVIGEAAPALSAWQNFYVIVGSSAGALTGLQFVVIALIAEARATGSMQEIRAFGSPTVVHFCAALLISGIAAAPWNSTQTLSIVFGLCGILGVLYSLSVVRHARRQTGYHPDAEDWTWYVALPLAAYVSLLIAATLLNSHPAGILFWIAGTTLLLLFLGIHNAWDTVTYITVKHLVKKDDAAR